jgi:penicillin-binding protein 1A
MEDVVNYGTASAVRRTGFGGAVAGKTGTTSDGADVWFVGYTPDIVAGVWVGYDTRRPLPARANGGNVSAPVFGRIMRRIHQTHSVAHAFAVPDGIVWRRIDPESGLVLEEDCIPRDGTSRSEVFLREAQPGTVCPRHESENIFDLLGDFLGGLFNGRTRSDEPEPGAVSGSGDVLGAERIARRESSRR